MKRVSKTLSVRAIRAKLREFISDQSGYAYLFTGLAFSSILGFSGAAVDMANWYSERRVSQNIADAAAISGTYADFEGGDLAAIQAVALTEALRNGYVNDGASQLNVSLSSAAPAAGIIPRVEVSVRRQVPVFLASMFVGSDVMVSARAVGGLRGLGPQCIIALDETAARAVEFTGSTLVNVGCGVISNSESDESLYIGGNAELLANPAQAFGDIAIEGSGVLTSLFPPMPFSPRVADPYEGQTFPSKPASCDNAGVSVSPSDASTIGPAVSGGSLRICGEVDVKGTLTLQPGTYYVDEGDFEANASAHITGNDVTIVMTGDDPSDVGTVKVNGGATLNLTAPQTGDYQGIVFYQDPIADGSGVNKFNGGATMNLAGVVYFKKEAIEFSGGADIPGCTMLVSRTVKFTGNSYLKNDVAQCQAAGLGNGLGGTAQQIVVLVE